MDAVRDATIILPTLNEVDNIGPMLATLKSLYPQQRILVVDDDSDDGTAAAVRGWKDVGLMVRDRSERGLSASIYDGILNCDTTYFVVMDCDFQHPPESVSDLLSPLREGADLVVGVRNDRSALSPFRRFSSSVAHLLAHYYLFLRSKPSSRDIMTGFFAGRTKLFQNVIVENRDGLEMRGFKALFDLLKFSPSDIDVREVEFEFRPRRAGKSKISPLVIVSIFRQCGRGGEIVSRFLSELLRRG